MQQQVPGLSPNANAFQFPHLQGQTGAPHLNMPTQVATHRRNQSALPNMNMGPPPAPSTGAAGPNFGELSQPNPAGGHRENDGTRGGRGGHGGAAGGGHQRRHSLALPEAKKAAELAQQKRTTSGFQFPIPGQSRAGPGSGKADRNPPDTEEKPTEAPQANVGQHLTPQASLTVRSGNRGGAHNRSQSAALGPNGRAAAVAAAAHGRTPSAFQLSVPSNDLLSTAAAQQQDFQRRGSQGNHARTSSRNFDGNWRQHGNTQNQGQEQPAPMRQFAQNQNAGLGAFQPGHRVRASMGQSVGTLGSFQYPTQPQIIQLPSGQMVVQQQPQLFPGHQLNALQLSQLQALQAAQLSGQQLPGLQHAQHPQQQLSAQQQQQQQQQQRKTLFTPYLPQASLPALLNDGQLVAGVLRVNKKNRSDAYVSTQDGLLDADIFICGSKDRNRALEGDLVAVELLDVDDVWSQKREKEEKKKRKDITDSRTNTTGAMADKSASGDADASSQRSGAAEGGGIRRRGSLRQRPTQKKNDDVEVEGQSLLLMEEEEVSDEQKPLYAGHVVAVIERVAGQMFSG